MKIAFVLMDNFWQRKGIGSSRIRGRWIIKYLNRIEGVEAEELVQGKEYDVMVFQKVYWKEMARAFQGINILDICDPDWLEGAEVVSFCKEMDLITVPTEAMKEAIEKFTDTPVAIIPDGVDMEILPPQKKHMGTAKKVVWFGYSNNMEVLYPAFSSIKKLGLKLLVVSDGNLNTSECEVENVKWNAETCDAIYQEADFALLPEKTNGRFLYKSNNKTLHAWALGLPVAKTQQEMERFMNGEERKKEATIRYAEAKEGFSVAKSAKMLYSLIRSYKLEVCTQKKRQN